MAKERWKELSDDLILLGKWIQRNGLPDPNVVLAEVASPRGVSEGFLRSVKFILSSLEEDEDDKEEDSGKVKLRKRNLYLKFVLLEFPYLQNCIYRHEFPDMSRLRFFQKLMKVVRIEDGWLLAE